MNAESNQVQYLGGDNWGGPITEKKQADASYGQRRGELEVKRPRMKNVHEYEQDLFSFLSWIFKLEPGDQGMW
jgi:hypothetical protein